MNLTGTIYWGAVSQNSDIFFVSLIGNFLLDIGKKHTAFGNMTQNWSSKCAKNPV